jgi:transcription termination/antitermination protein NusA
MVEALARMGQDARGLRPCADWELAGGWTTVNGKRVKDDGLLEKFDVSSRRRSTW